MQNYPVAPKTRSCNYAFSITWSIFTSFQTPGSERPKTSGKNVNKIAYFMLSIFVLTATAE